MGKKARWADRVSETEIFELLERIERGELQLTFEEHPNEIFAGNVTYKTPDGWTLRVFNDAMQWDSLDSVMAPDGRTLDFDEFTDALMFYRPPEEVARKAYSIE